MALIKKEDLLKNLECNYKDVHFEELGGELRIKALSFKEQLAFEEQSVDVTDQSQLVFYLIVNCCIDEEGNKLFTEQDVEALECKSASLVLKIFKEILNLNQLEESEIDNLAKN